MHPYLKAWLGYVAFGLVAFVLALYLTFPYDALERYVVDQARAQGVNLRIASMGPGLFGVTASGVQLLGQPKGDAPPESLKVDSVALRPSLFPLGVAVRGKAMGGTVHAAVGGLGALSVHADFDELDPSKGNFKAFTGIAAKGLASGSLDLTLPKTAPGADGKPHDPNLAEANGELSLDLSRFTIEGGTVTVPMYGTPTPVDLPKIDFGNLVAAVDVEKGTGKIKTLSAKSPDLELQGSGTVRLSRRLPFSELNVELRLKAEQAFVKRLGILGSGLSMLPADPKNPGFRVAHLTGFLGSPRLAQR